MVDEKEFRYLLEELKVFYRNLNKDSQERRENVSVIRRKLEKINKLELEFKNLRDNFNTSRQEADTIKQVKLQVDGIVKYFETIKSILDDRLESSEQIINIETMAGKFDLRTAASLLPAMDGSENGTKLLVDAIELYDSLLDNDGEKLLTLYVLKTRLTQSAKIRLKDEYDNNQLLIADIKTHFLTKRSATTLSSKLSNARQGSKSLDEFGKNVEELLVDLTITQADGNANAVGILRNVNEKIAINTFANGLQNPELRTIIKARNYSTLNEAIRGAKDEELPNQNKIFHFRGHGRGNYRGTFNNYNRNPHNRGSFNNHFNKNSYNSRGSSTKNPNRGGFNSRQSSQRNNGINRGSFNRYNSQNRNNNNN